MRFEAIPNGNGVYFISDEGTVRRLVNGSFKPIQPTITDGYETIKINGERYYVHKLVAEIFVEGRSRERCKVAHRNGDNLDNRATNLVWATPREVRIVSRYTPDCRESFWDVDHNFKNVRGC